MDEVVKALLEGGVTGTESATRSGDPLAELMSSFMGIGTAEEVTSPDDLAEAVEQTRGKSMQDNPLLAPILARLVKKFGLSTEQAQQVVEFLTDRLAKGRTPAKKKPRRTTGGSASGRKN